MIVELQPMRTKMEAAGYREAGGCQCDGYATTKFTKDDYTLHWRRKQYKFRIKQAGTWLMDWKPLTELEETLNEIH